MRKPMKKRLMPWVTIMVFGVLCCAEHAFGQDAGKPLDKLQALARNQILVVSKVSSNPKKHYRYLMPLVQYASGQMQDLGIKEARVLLAKDNEQMIRYIKQGKVDWVEETPFSAVLYQEKTGAEILLRRWKKGVPEYHTIFITRKDSGISSLTQLKGKTIAFEDAGSTSAYIVPAALLLKQGLKLERLASPREKPSADRVGFVFAGQEINMSTWVHKRLVVAAAFSNLDWIKQDHNPKAFRNDFKIFFRTRPFPRAFAIVRKDLDIRIKQRLKETLLKAHKDAIGKSALDTFQETTRYDEPDAQVWTGLEEFRSIMKTVKKELE